MTEETEITVVDVEPVPTKPKPIDVNDVDASWDGKGSLDDHRQQSFAKIKQPGFGAAGKVKADGE